MQYCNICGSEKFEDMRARRPSIFVRKGVRCSGCGSLERHRLIYELLVRLDLLTPGVRALHIAPERSLARKLAPVLQSGYVCGDKDVDRYKKLNAVELDLCHQLQGFEQGTMDFVLHNHVMEHLPCNYTIVLQRLHLLLKPGGWHIFTLPFMAGGYRESLEDHSDHYRAVNFGQWDHHRVFSADDLPQTVGMVFEVPAIYNARLTFGEDRLRELNIPEDQWDGYNNNSIIAVQR